MGWCKYECINGLVIVFTLYTYLFIGLQWCIFLVIEGHISKLQYIRTPSAFITYAPAFAY